MILDLLLSILDPDGRSVSVVGDRARQLSVVFPGVCVVRVYLDVTCDHLRFGFDAEQQSRVQQTVNNQIIY